MQNQTRLNHNSEETAYLVNNYPWGYTLKTKRKYWIETTTRGDRFVFQTLNPKTNKWCKPKKSTYSAVLALYIKDNGHVTYKGFNFGWSEIETINKFIDLIGGEDKLSAQQQKALKKARYIKKVQDSVTYEIKPADPVEESKKRVLQKRDLLKAKAELESQLGTQFPYVQIKQSSNLCESLHIYISLDEKNTWVNGYFRNSRTIRTSIYPYSKQMQWVGEDLTGLYTLKINPSYKLRSSTIKTRDIKKGKTMDKVINSLVKQLKQYKELI